MSNVESKKQMFFLLRWVESLGATIIENLHALGEITLFAGRFFYWMVKPPYRFKLLFEQLYFVGNKSIFIVALTGSFSRTGRWKTSRNS